VKDKEMPSEKFKRLLKWRNDFAAMEIEYGAKSFFGKPEKWLKDPHWFCEEGHVSGFILKCEEDGDLCLECHNPVIIGPPVGEREFSQKYMRFINGAS
jgi:hypothetical protein